MKLKICNKFYSVHWIVGSSKLLITGEYNEKNDIIPLSDEVISGFKNWASITADKFDYKRNLFFVSDLNQQGVVNGCWVDPQDLSHPYVEMNYDNWHLLGEPEAGKRSEAWGAMIFHKDYATIVPQPPINAVAVFSKEDAEKAFRYCPSLGFVYAINEDTGRVGICYSVMEAEHFYKNVPTEGNFDKANSTYTKRINKMQARMTNIYNRLVKANSEKRSFATQTDNFVRMLLKEGRTTKGELAKYFKAKEPKPLDFNQLAEQHSKKIDKEIVEHIVFMAKFKRGDAVFCTYAHNTVTNKPFGFLYDFGYWNKEGNPIVYNHGENSMQDTHCFDLKKGSVIRLATEEDLEKEFWGI